jgi:hypothetical protein
MIYDRFVIYESCRISFRFLNISHHSLCIEM